MYGADSHPKYLYSLSKADYFERQFGIVLLINVDFLLISQILHFFIDTDFFIVIWSTLVKLGACLINLISFVLVVYSSLYSPNLNNKTASRDWYLIQVEMNKWLTYYICFIVWFKLFIIHLHFTYFPMSVKRHPILSKFPYLFGCSAIGYSTHLHSWVNFTIKIVLNK